MGTIGYKAFGVTLHGRLGGVINAGAGDQGQQRRDQIGDGRVFADAGHDFSKGCGYHRGNKIAQQRFTAQGLDDAIGGPGDTTAQSAQQIAIAVDIEDNDKACAGNHGEDRRSPPPFPLQ